MFSSCQPDPPRKVRPSYQDVEVRYRRHALPPKADKLGSRPAACVEHAPAPARTAPPPAQFEPWRPLVPAEAEAKQCDDGSPDARRKSLAGSAPMLDAANWASYSFAAADER